MRPLLQAYRLANLLSIDVAAGAVVGAAFFARILKATLFPQAYIVLALTVWIIYTADHLLDAKRLAGPASTPRHRLHQQYFSILFILVCVAALIAFILVMFVRTRLMITGIGLAGICAAYLVSSRWLKFAKELAATILYAGGVLLPSLSISIDLTAVQVKLISEFVLLVLINMLLFAQMSYGTDLTDRQQSFATVAGPAIVSRLIGCLFACFGLTALLFPSGPYGVEQATLGVMALVLLLIFLFPGFFSLEERYRLIGDAVFLVPAVVLVFC